MPMMLRQRAWHLSSDMPTLDTVQCTVGSC